MNTKIILWWIGKNYNQLFICLFLIFFTAQIMRLIITNVF